jgi:hypothetical protein
LNVKAPSKSTIWNMVMDSRRDAAQKQGSNDLVISRCHAKLPVEHDGDIVFPLIELLVDGENGAVIGAEMEQERESSNSIATATARSPGGRRIVVDGDIAKKLGRDNLPAHVPVLPSAARTATARILGRGFGTIELIYQLSRAIAPKRMLRARMDAALRPADARRVISEQLTAHNAARGAPPPIVNWDI